MRSGVDQRGQVDVKDADVDADRDDEKGEEARHKVTDHLQPGEGQVAQDPLPKVVPDEG